MGENDFNDNRVALTSFLDNVILFFFKPVDFKIEDCLEYMKSGIEAIIEDDVTSRFEAVELENWNLLTRTNKRFSFIPWNLKVIWVIGFLIRYIVLMPVRALICFIGVSCANLLRFCVIMANFQGFLDFLFVWCRWMCPGQKTSKNFARYGLVLRNANHRELSFNRNHFSQRRKSTEESGVLRC